MTSFRFDEALRAEITSRLGRFELRRRVDAGGLKRAAVAVVVVEADQPPVSGKREAAFLLTKRTPKLRAHGGQWALPGGRVDPGETIEQMEKWPILRTLLLWLLFAGALGAIFKFTR